MLRKNYIFIYFVLLVVKLTASMELPYTWELKTEHFGNQQYRVTARCFVQKDWHVYSINNPNGGSEKTSFKWEQTEGIQVVQHWTEPEPTKIYEEVFEVEQWYHSDTVRFQTIIQLTDDFKVDSLTLTIRNMACMDDGMCTPPDEQSFSLALEKEDGSVFWVFWIGFGAGILALLTPCVFPMIPMTVTYFTKQKSNGLRNAIIYGLSIVGIYVSLGLGITLIYGPTGLYDMASSATFNLIFFAVFLIFAISFLGAFEITMPQALISKVDKKADGGGLIGIFFMAFTLILVSFSCTGPVMASLLMKTAFSGEVMMPFFGMLGFGVALGLPFTLFAIFPNWLNKLPKSGSWLNSVKVVLGFVELALALKFLSNADLVFQAGILKREIFIASWVAISLLIVLYLLGIIRMQHDQKVEQLSVTRTLFASGFLMFTVYLIPGMFGAPLKLLSGVLPPDHYSENWQVHQSTSSEVSASAVATHRQTCPNNLPCFHDYDEGLAAAIAQNKPILLDFTGYTCANCRRVEEYVWKDPTIDALIRNEYVLVSLYVDDENNPLPKEDYYVSSLTGKKITTYGAKWKDFQMTRYQEITQPLYILLDHQENMLMPKMHYDNATIPKYTSFLKEGLQNFKQ